MKKYYIILIVIVILFSCNSEKSAIINAQKDKVYSVKRIDSVGQVYIYYLKRNDSIFKVMSKKSNPLNYPIIKVGKSYNLSIKSYFLPEEFHIKYRVAGVKFNGEMILMERDSVVSDLFLSKNIKGKYYVK